MSDQTSTAGGNYSTKNNTLGILIKVLLLVAFFAFPFVSIRNYENLMVGAGKLGPIPKDTDCGVVLTGGGGRIREGIVLMSLKKISNLIISGVHQHSTLAETYPEITFYPELNLEKIILERTSTSTASNATHSLNIVETLKCNKMVLITSDYHMFRALKTFQSVFPSSIQIIPYPVSSQKIKAFSTLLDEWMKFQFYDIFVF